MDRRGFTLLETVVVIGVIMLILPVLVSAIQQVMVQTDRNSTRISALTPLESTGRWLGRDVPLAQATDLISGNPPVNQVILYWTHWGDTTNYDSYSATGVAYKRIRATYSLVGTNLTRTGATCANKDDADVKCVNQVVSGAAWADSTKWVDGQAVLLSSGSFNSASRVADPGSPATAAPFVASVTFSRSGSVITVDVTSYPRGSSQPGEARTYRYYGTLLTTTDPIR